MAKKEAPVRKYKFSDAKLIQLVDEKIIFATRDNADLDPQGVTEDRLDALGLKREAFAELPDDDELQEPVNKATENQDNAAEVVRTHIRNVRRMAKNKYGESSAEYRGFAFDGMNELKEDDLFRAMKRVIRRAEAHAADLLSEGLDTDKVNAMKAANTAYDGTLDIQKDKIALRDIAQQGRVNAGNEIYTELVKICETGKDFYFEKDEAKYNDYIIYDTPSGGPEPTPPTP